MNKWVTFYSCLKLTSLNPQLTSNSILKFYFNFFTPCIVMWLLQIRPTNCTIYNVLIYKIPTCFGSHWPILREYSCMKSLGHTIISTMWWSVAECCIVVMVLVIRCQTLLEDLGTIWSCCFCVFYEYYYHNSSYSLGSIFYQYIYGFSPVW